MSRSVSVELNFQTGGIPFDYFPELLELHPVRLRTLSYVEETEGVCYVELQMNLHVFDLLYFRRVIHVVQDTTHYVFPSVPTSYAHLIPRRLRCL